MKRVLIFLKKMNPHIVLPILIVLSIAGTVFFIAKWAKGIDSDYDRDLVEDGYDIEVLDRVYYVYPENLAGHIPNETKKVLCFGNAPFADDRDSKNNLCSLMAEETGAEIINLSIPDSYLSMGSPQGNITDPLDYYTFYWLMCFASLEDKEQLIKDYNNTARGTSAIGDDVVDYLCKLDLNTIDTIVLMYDASDYLIGRIKETPENVSNPRTFCGNMFAGIELIESLYPHIQIIIMSPTYAYAIDENNTNPSPKKFILKSNPSRFTTIIPAKPMIHAIIFLNVIFSCLNIRQATIIEKNAFEPLIIVPFTPVVLARPI